ncbi:hypothetical protein NC652_041569 [Populus alba x Populus x berolinensis]|nr:hypothetical protein NC652_041569 [Populus alba x Populus x berolinensis]
MPMKKPSLFAASVAAAAASAFPVSSTSSGCNSNVKEAGSNKDQQRSASMDKFAPRYDGLRFIETLAGILRLRVDDKVLEHHNSDIWF